MTREIVSNVQRPRRGALIIVYSIWIGVIVSIALIPELAFLGVVAFVLMLLIWLPYWAYRNWSSITEDLPATYATALVAVMATVLGAAYCAWGTQPILGLLVSSGMLNQRNEVAHSHWIDFVAFQLTYSSLFLLWRLLRKRLQATLIAKSGGPGVSQVSDRGRPHPSKPDEKGAIGSPHSPLCRPSRASYEPQPPSQRSPRSWG